MFSSHEGLAADDFWVRKCDCWCQMRSIVRVVRMRVGGRVGRRRGPSGRRQRSPQGAQLRVLSLLVSAKIHLALECSSAKVAGEGLEASVLPRVRNQIRTLAESFSAHLTFVRLFTWK